MNHILIYHLLTLYHFLEFTSSLYHISFQLSIFMKDIFDLLTEQEGEGILKPLLKEPDLQKLLQNPFHISDNNIKVNLDENLSS